LKENYPKFKALFTTLEGLHNVVAENENFCPTVLICDDAEIAHDQFIFAACGKFESSLERVALFGNKERYPLTPIEQKRNHLRNGNNV
jgi:hypothetical protein